MALLVGGVGIANVMVISVLERRSEIGLRRALGATQRNVGVQFLAESLLLAGLGGAAGTLLGAAVTLGYATHEDWSARSRRSPWRAECSSRSSPAASRASTRHCAPPASHPPKLSAPRKGGSDPLIIDLALQRASQC